MPNASVGIDRLRTRLRLRSRLSRRQAEPAAQQRASFATAFHRRTVRWVVDLRRAYREFWSAAVRWLSVLGRRAGLAPLEPQPTVALVHLARAIEGLDHRSPGGSPPARGEPRPSRATDPSGPRSLAATPQARPRPSRPRPLGRGPGPIRHVARLLEAARRQPERTARKLLSLARRAVEHERAAATTVAAILVFAALSAAVPAFGGAPTGGVGGPGGGPRLTVGGGVLGPGSPSAGGNEISAPDGWVDEPFDPFWPNDGSGDGPSPNPTEVEGGGPEARLLDPEAAANPAPAGPFLADGTLLKPVAVDTTIPDARDRIVTYRVQSGDTLTGIARRFGISMMTLWWANDLDSKDDLHVGQILRIPPVDGLVVTVKEGDTLDDIAAETGVAKETIAAFNGLTSDGLVVGQVLVVPGGRGEAIPTPKPTPRPTARPVTRTSGSVSSPTRYSGGALLWPVAGGYLSQYYHYGHYGIDIAADYGTRVRAAAAGRVIFAGWKNNGGGYQVWIAHGSGLYTGYYHMSAVSVGTGQSVARGQTVGRIGTSGWATGPHLHFEVWLGYPWESGSRRVNPLRYL